MSIFTRRPILTATVIAGASLVLLPVAYLAGWLGDLGQVSPTLSHLAAAQEKLSWQEAHQPKEPPLGVPSVSAAWTDTSVTLDWARIPKADSYTVYRAPGSASFASAEAIAEVTPHGKPSYTDASVQPGTNYSYWVTANNAAGQGPASFAVALRTYLSWTSVAKAGEAAARTIDAVQWSKTAWGLLGQTSHTVNGPVWNVAGTLESPLSVTAAQSTWITARGTSWSIGRTPVQAQLGAGFTRITGSASVPALASGQPTPNDLALWDQNGKWVTAVVSPNTSPLPPEALILNNYGQAVGLTTSSGTIARG